MATKKLSEEQKLRNKVTQNVNSKKNFLNRLAYRETKDAFLEKFILCEIALKAILQNYFSSRNEDKKVEALEMGSSTIEAALKVAGYKPSEEQLKMMFKAKQNRGQKSARDLRNAIVHDLNVNDIKEVVDRKDELFELLDNFLAFLTSPHTP